MEMFLLGQVLKQIEEAFNITNDMVDALKKRNDLLEKRIEKLEKQVEALQDGSDLTNLFWDCYDSESRK